MVLFFTKRSQIWQPKCFFALIWYSEKNQLTLIYYIGKSLSLWGSFQPHVAILHNGILTMIVLYYCIVGLYVPHWPSRYICTLLSSLDLSTIYFNENAVSSVVTQSISQLDICFRGHWRISGILLGGGGKSRSRRHQGRGWWGVGAVFPSPRG